MKDLANENSTKQAARIPLVRKARYMRAAPILTGVYYEDF
jgi:hypothetical protein